jgi:hypothetical protein
MTVACALSALGVAVPRSASHAGPAAPSASVWKVPAGIPRPEFGINEKSPQPPVPWTRAVDRFYYVDASRHEATDQNNPFGTPERPRQSIPDSLPAGAVVELHGTYDHAHTSPHTLVAHGTAAQPVFIRGASPRARPLIRAPWELTASYTILENLKFGPRDAGRTGSLAIVAPGSHVALRASDLHGNATAGGLGIVSWNPAHALDHVVIAGNAIHDNGNVHADYDQDVHGIEVGSRISRLWVLDNELARNSGDGIQINGERGGVALTHHIYVARNTAHDNKQTGFWTKQASDVIFSENLCFGHRAGNSSYGQCMGLQYAPERVWFVSNHIHDCDYGIALSSDSDLGSGKTSFIIGNVIHGIHHSAPYNPNTGWSNAAIMMAGGTVHAIVNNTIYDVDGGINSPIAGLNYIVNNIVVKITEPRGNAIFLEQPPAAGSAVHDNVFGADARFRLGDRTLGPADVRTASLNRFLSPSVVAVFVDPAEEDFRLLPQILDAQSGSAEPGKIADLYRSLYGVDPPVDFRALGASDEFSLRPRHEAAGARGRPGTP